MADHRQDSQLRAHAGARPGELPPAPPSAGERRGKSSLSAGQTANPNPSSFAEVVGRIGADMWIDTAGWRVAMVHLGLDCPEPNPPRFATVTTKCHLCHAAWLDALGVLYIDLGPESALSWTVKDFIGALTRVVEQEGLTASQPTDVVGRFVGRPVPSA